MPNPYEGLTNPRDEAAASFRIQIQELLIKRDQWQTCMNCDSYTKEKGMGADPPFYCMRHGGTPPPNVVVNGCPQHMMDIPF